jgi:hypothetical protein
MERTSVYITVAEAVRIFRVSAEDVLRFCGEKKIGFAQFGQESEIYPSASDLAFVLKRALTGDVTYVPLREDAIFVEREKKEKVVTYTNGALHHDDAPLLPPLDKKLLLKQDAPTLLDTPLMNPLLEDGKEDVLLEKQEHALLLSPEIQRNSYDAVTSSILPVAQEEVSHPTPTVLREQTSNSVVNEFQEEEKKPVYNVKPVFIPKEAVFPQQTERKHTPQNPRPIAAEKKIPVPHVPIFAPLGSIHPLAQPPLVIPFATPAPAAHVKVAAVFTQPHARAAEWMPWMRTSQWLKRAVSKATKNPEITQAHSGLPIVSFGISPSSASPVSSPVSPSVQRTPAQPAPTPLPDERQAPIIRMQHPVVQDAVDHALFGAFVAPTAEPQNDTSKTTLQSATTLPETPKLIDGKPEVRDSFDALLFS